MTTSKRELKWAAAMEKLSIMNKKLPTTIPERLDHLVTEEFADRLLTLADTFYMGSHSHVLCGVVDSPQSPEYSYTNLNNLYAFRHLADPESSVTQRASIVLLQCAIQGLSGPSNRFAAVDYTSPERYEAALARLTVIVGMMNLGTETWQMQRLLEYRDGVYVLPPALDVIVQRHPDKAELIVRLIAERKLTGADTGVLAAMFSPDVVPALLDGVL